MKRLLFAVPDMGTPIFLGTLIFENPTPRVWGYRGRFFSVEVSEDWEIEEGVRIIDNYNHAYTYRKGVWEFQNPNFMTRGREKEIDTIM